MNLFYDENKLFSYENNKKNFLSALEIFELDKGNLNVYDVFNNKLDNFRFSMISLNTKIKFKIIGNAIKPCILALYRNQEYEVQNSNLKFLDYCIINNSWYYLNGDINIYSEVCEKLNIINQTNLNYQEYMNVIRELNYNNIDVVNNIDYEIQNNCKIDSCDEGLKANLYEYQKAGFNWMTFMINNNCGCILADEMGLGKTLQVIATIGNNLKNNPNSKYLVVAPISLLVNWKREIEKFYPSLKCFINYGKKQIFYYENLLEYDVIITSYSNVISNLSMYEMVNWQILILDEAQNIKNPYAKRTKAIKMIKRNHAIAVTGTPFENHMTDLWSIIDFVFPNYLGTLGNFNDKYTDSNNSAIKIERIITPIMIRRRVSEVAKDLPERIDIPQPILMTQEEAQYYNNGKNELVELSDLKKSKLEVIQKLRLFCTHPMVYNKELNFTDPTIISNKYTRLCEIIEDIINRNEKVIIFTSFVEMRNIMIKDLSVRFGKYINYIDGSVESLKRQQIVDEFSKIKGSAILVLNPIAAGTGLNITAANNVIHYNLNWNPALEDQASARAYRRGQEKRVFIYRLYYTNTIEELINNKIENKRELSELAVVGNNGETIEEELIKILSISPTEGD